MDPIKAIVFVLRSGTFVFTFALFSTKKQNLFISHSFVGRFVHFSFWRVEVAAKWPTYNQELQDEMNDAKILNAVRQSMNEYEKSHRHHRQKRAEKSVCYGELGCFEDSGPFGYLDMLPQSPEEIGTKFFFYSTENRSDRPLLEIPYLNMSRMFNELYGENDNFTSAETLGENATYISPEYKKNLQKLKTFDGFDRLSIRVIVHGFGAACHHVWIYEMRTALMAVVRNDFNYKLDMICSKCHHYL